MSIKRSIQQLVAASFDKTQCPSSEQLANYVLGHTTGNEQLQLAQHIRSCSLCQYFINLSIPPNPQPKRLLAQLIERPLVFGMRSESRPNLLRYYQAADIAIELLMASAFGETWTITGQILQSGTPLPDCRIRLRQGRWSSITTSDSEGFFHFIGLPDGKYKLSVSHGHIRVEIADLQLHDTDIP